MRTIGQFQRRHPAIAVTLTEAETDALIAATVAGTLNAALIGLGPDQAPPPELESRLVVREPAVWPFIPSTPCRTPLGPPARSPR